MIRENAGSLDRSAHVDRDRAPCCVMLTEGAIAVLMAASLARCGPLCSKSQDKYIILHGFVCDTLRAYDFDQEVLR